jgi:hypothetical protein
VSSAWLSAAIQEFEQVTLDNGTELFRVWARAQGGDDPEPRPMLETREHNGIAQIYEPLSSGGDRQGLLRLAYVIPTDHVGPSTAFSLRLPDGYRIELPEPTPGENRDEPDDGERWQDAEPGAEPRESPELDNGMARRIAELEQELGELRSAGGELQRRLAELTAEHERVRVAAAAAQEELASLRGSHAGVEEELRSTRQAVAQALGELELARGERDEALEASRVQHDEHARLTARVRQLQARIELMRADATGGRSGADPRLQKLESEREQLATHVRALAELLSTDERPGNAVAAAEPGGAVAHVATDRLETLRARAVRDANEHAERELRRLRAGTPR